MTWEASSGIDSDDFAAGASLQDSSQARAAELHVAACSRCGKPFQKRRESRLFCMLCTIGLCVTAPVPRREAAPPR